MSKEVKNTQDMLNCDNEGNIIPAFPASKQAKNDQRKTSVAYSTVAVILHILSFVPIIAITIVLAAKCYELMPYYSFWPFVGTILAGVFGLVFMAIALTVSRRKSKHSIRNQTVKITIAFVCLTSVFGVLMTYAFPDVIAMATQNTIKVEDLYYNGEVQAETNALLERDFIRYNLLAGNLGGEFSYYDLSRNTKSEGGVILSYENEYIDKRVEEYTAKSQTDINAIIADMKAKNQMKYELYNFVYTAYILNDYDYAFLGDFSDASAIDTTERQALALAIVDYEYEFSSYTKLLKEGFNNKRLKQLFDDHFDSFNQDGYLPFDDPLLLLAQMSGRMTIPAVVRLILDDIWTYTQPVLDEEGNVIGYDEENSFLYEMYDPKAVEEFEKNGGEYNEQGVGVNDKGWLIYEETGMVKRPMKWLVLDMLGDPMAVASIDLLGSDIGGIVMSALGTFPDLVGAVGGLLTEDLQKVLEFATNGASLGINLFVTDTGELAINIVPSNYKYAVLGYMQMSWVQSDNLLMAVVNVMGLRNWLCIFGAIGAVLVILGGVCREMGRKTRERTEISRDRILREKAAKEYNSMMSEGEEATSDVQPENSADGLVDEATTAQEPAAAPEA